MVDGEMDDDGKKRDDDDDQMINLQVTKQGIDNYHRQEMVSCETDIERLSHLPSHFLGCWSMGERW